MKEREEITRKDMVISLLLFRVFADIIRDIDENLQDIPDPWRSRHRALQNDIWRRAVKYLSAPLEEPTETPASPKRVRQEHLVHVIANSMNEYLKLSNEPEKK